MTGSIRNFEKLNFTPKSSVFCFSQGQTSEYDRLAHEQLSACNLVNLSVLTEAESSNVFVNPMLERPPKSTGLVETVKSMQSSV